MEIETLPSEELLQHNVKKYRAIVCHYDSVNNTKIAKKVGFSKGTITKLRNKFKNMMMSFLIVGVG